VVVKKSLCIRCGACARACPVDAIYLDRSGEPFVCIQCGRCVEFCPHDCLMMFDAQSPLTGNEGKKEAGA
jgi:formate hydrogenlyase subunit 6/NADH:ubiquinone oxidoreductase subunit I